MSSNAKKEEKEGTTYQTGIGLNLDLTKSDSLLAELPTLIRNLTTSQLTEYEKLVPPFTTRPTHPKISYQGIINYEFMVFDTETTSTGNHRYVSYLQLRNLEIASTSTSFLQATSVTMLLLLTDYLSKQ